MPPKKKAAKKQEAKNIVDTAKIPHAAPVGRTHNSPEPKKR